MQAENTLFNAINRGKESLTANLCEPCDRDILTAPIARADVVIQNFRAGLIDRQGLGFDTCT